MGKAKIEVSVESPLKSWKQKFKGKLEQLYLFVAANLQTNRGLLFKSGGGINGHEKWAPLRLRDGQPLKDRGTLSQSIGPISRRGTGTVRPQFNKGSIVRYGADMVVIGTTLKYARLMNDGGTIVPKKGGVLWIPLPKGKAATQEIKLATAKGKTSRRHMGGIPIVRLANGKWFMLAKKVTIPPRPFDKLTREDSDELRAALTNEVARCLNE